MAYIYLGLELWNIGLIGILMSNKRKKIGQKSKKFLFWINTPLNHLEVCNIF